MARYDVMRFFKTEAEAREFAEKVGSDSWGWMKDIETGKITKWYVDCNVEDLNK